MLYALEVWDRLSLIQKRRLFFCQIKLVFIKVRCLINANVNLETVLEGQDGSKQNCLIPFVRSNLGAETFLKKMEHQKRMCYNRGLRHLCILCIEVSRKSCLPFNCFLVIKGIPKALFSFISWLLNFSDLPMAQIRGKDIH